ncbi:MAG: zf-HC2 domain-containing protein [Bacillota bacterium]|nr:zf-HC2 domain-containing protein [Bacillota bacterium]
MSGPVRKSREEEERIHELLPFYAAGTLSPAERQEVDRHLASCAACRRELQLWREIAGAVAVETAELGEPAASRRPLASRPTGSGAFSWARWRPAPTRTSRYSGPLAQVDRCSPPPNRRERPGPREVPWSPG